MASAVPNYKCLANKGIPASTVLLFGTIKLFNEVFSREEVYAINNVYRTRSEDENYTFVKLESGEYRVKRSLINLYRGFDIVSNLTSVRQLELNKLIKTTMLTESFKMPGGLNSEEELYCFNLGKLLTALTLEFIKEFPVPDQ